MSKQFSLVYQLPPVAMLAPEADAAGRVSPYRNIKAASKAYVVARVNQGFADNVTLTLTQAQDVAGTGAKALAAVPIWLNDNTATTDAYAIQPAAASFSTDTTLADKIVVFEILPEAAFDVANGFTTIALATGASNAANITAADLFVLTDFAGASLPSTYV